MGSLIMGNNGMLFIQLVPFGFFKCVNYTHIYIKDIVRVLVSLDI